ncbi:hypothetical protein ColTof3_14481 [Colletotrichum tofieldiae]|nr:hypothetical protein ColTof3_14481 [Colletotrichum tofieldiae]
MAAQNANPNASLEPTHEIVMIDGVLCYPSIDLVVLVVGGGPGGYFTALECWRKGYNVRVLEKNTGNFPISEWP